MQLRFAAIIRDFARTWPRDRRELLDGITPFSSSAVATQVRTGSACPGAGSRTPSASQNTQGRKLQFMPPNENQKSADIYVKVAGTLMVVLLIFGGLHIFGVLR
jgi:hypothetical protein